MEIAAAVAAALLVTNIELALRAGRAPFGDLRMKALWWWLAVMGIDAVAALLIVGGLVAANAIPPAPDLSSPSWVSGAIAGALGPLGLRSPIRRAKVGATETPVGMTYYYDVARVRALYALDERLGWLVRSDLETLRVKVSASGTTADLLANEIRTHASEHPGLDAAACDAVESAIGDALSFPKEEARVRALIKTMQKFKFKALLDRLPLAAPAADLAEPSEPLSPSLEPEVGR